MRQVSALRRFLDRVPLYVSYTILLSGWTGFVFVLGIYETLLKRHQKWHFIAQMAIYNTLMGLTILSLMVASNRSPGHPDPLLAPFPRGDLALSLNASPDPEKHSHRPTPLTFSSGTAPPSGGDSDDIPLRALQNPSWMSSRSVKDRPSPLPPTRIARQVTSLGPFSSAQDEGNAPTLPFPLQMSPFVPTSSATAGEAADSASSAEGEALLVEGGGDLYGAMSLPLRGGHVDNMEGGSRTPLMAKAANGAPRWCRKCETWKPDRAHHCSFCQRCVLKMDHHCVWIGACVGYRNYKAFLLFVSYGTLTAVYQLAESIYALWRFFVDIDPIGPSPPSVQAGGLQKVNANFSAPQIPNLNSSPDTIEVELAPVVFMLLALSGALFSLTVGSLAGYHWWLACNNTTTLENMTHTYPSALLPDLKSPGPYTPNANSRHWRSDHLLSRSERVRLRDQARGINIYDLGWRRNLRTLLVGPCTNGGQLRRGLWRDVTYAMWPLGPGGSGDGHFWEYDAQKLERLRNLTEELRMGCEMAESHIAGSSANEGYPSRYEADDEESDASDASERESEWDEEDSEEDGGRSPTSNGENDRLVSNKGASGRTGRVSWFA